MKETMTLLEGTQESLLCVRSWKQEGDAIGIFHILHGMAEHSQRYTHFAEYLVQKGYIVYAHDHRKHGKSVRNNEEVGIAYKKDTFNNMVQDVNIVNEYIKETEENLPLYILGHSMGSMICRRYLQVYGSSVNKAIIMGTMWAETGMCKLGIGLGNVIESTHSKEMRSRFLNHLAVGGFNNSFKPARSPFDWLSRDEQQVDRYQLDPLCGYSYSARFYIELLKGFLSSQDKANILKTPKIPILFISGSEDPVGEKGVGVKKVVSLYSKLGYKTNITLKFFENARHEILNEINREEVYHYIATWVED